MNKKIISYQIFQPQKHNNYNNKHNYNEKIIEQNKKCTDSINNHQKEKITLEWRLKKPVKIITEKIIKERDCIFKLIIKKYNYKELETNLRNQEKKLIDKIITKKL